ncbi:VOC family protein [Nocardioides nanhaiensis]|uniref:VOC family protein n=1 Tax=Nocardioides nanhaiensis TaxID=1476871 RepID=A0ABP8WS56_9ACTN
MSAAETRLWPSMTFRDCDAMIAWLRAVGFAEHATYRDEEDPTVVVHAEWVHPGGGGLMFGSPRPGSPVAAPGASSVYLVVQDPDVVFDAAVAAGATVVRAMAEQGYGGCGGDVRDPEGNHWSFGSYQPR